MRVVGLHKLPFDPDRFEDDVSLIEGSPYEAVLRKQIRESYDNAWIVVVEDASQIKFDEFAHPTLGPNAQTAWMEQDLPGSAGLVRAGFFLHYVDQTKPLWYGDQKLALPGPSDPPNEVLDLMDYAAPA